MNQLECLQSIEGGRFVTVSPRPELLEHTSLLRSPTTVGLLETAADVTPLEASLYLWKNSKGGVQVLQIHVIKYRSAYVDATESQIDRSPGTARGLGFPVLGCFGE